MVDINRLVEIRWHGRGGQGAVTSAELLARAAIAEGKYAQAFPSFGPERRGAPVLSFVRVDSQKPIRTRASIQEPDVVVVLDTTLLVVTKITAGLKANGIAVINTRQPAEELRREFDLNCPLATVDATAIAREVLGVPITNTTMLGALIKATGIVKLETLEEPLKERFGRLAERNITAMKRAYQETSVEE